MEELTHSEVAVLRHGLALYLREAAQQVTNANQPFQLRELQHLRAVAERLLADPRFDRAKPDGTARLVEFSDG